MAVTLAVSNRKGGTGKTTVSVNLAAEMATMGQRVLLIDLDSQSHCAVGLGVKVGKETLTVHDIFRSRESRLANVIQTTAFTNLSLAPADPLFEHGSGLSDKELLVRALADENIASAFDLVILDTPPLWTFCCSMRCSLPTGCWCLLFRIPFLTKAFDN